MPDLSRRALLGATGLGAIGTAASWPRLTASDAPVAARTCSPWSSSAPTRTPSPAPNSWPRAPPATTKIRTLVATGTPPDVCLIANEGAQLFADRLAHPLDEFVQRDAAEMSDYFSDVHPSLVESFMYQGSLFMLPMDFNAANVYLNTTALQRAGLERPADDWTTDDFLLTARAMSTGAASGGVTGFRPYVWPNRVWGESSPGSTSTARVS